MSQKLSTSSARAHVAWATDLPRPDRRQHRSPHLERAASTDVDIEAERHRYRSAAAHSHVVWASDLPRPDRRRVCSRPVEKAAPSDRDLDFERTRYSSAATQSSLASLGAFVNAGSLLEEKREPASSTRKDSVSPLPPTALSSVKKGEEAKGKFGIHGRYSVFVYAFLLLFVLLLRFLDQRQELPRSE